MSGQVLGWYSADAVYGVLDDDAHCHPIHVRRQCGLMSDYFNDHHTTTTTLLWPFFRAHPGEPVPEENFWTL